MQLQILRLHDFATIPKYAHPTDSGLDLTAVGETIIPPHTNRLINTGLAIALPPDTEAQIRPRSGLALKHQITVLNTPGTIDEGYRGEICVILMNHGNNAFTVTQGMKIAQMVITPIIRVEIKATSQLGSTPRGAGGFGSTGF